MRIRRCGFRARETMKFSSARASLREDSASIESLPLYGVPFAVKDNIDVAGMPTTAACPDFAYTPGEARRSSANCSRPARS